MNRPIVANDPTGHYCVGDVEECVDDKKGGTGQGYQPPTGGGGGESNNHCNNDPDCELGPGHDEGGTGPVCYPGELVCQLGAGEYEVGTSPVPDYFSLNGCAPIVLIFGICGQIVRDYYNNWYWGFGPGIMSGPAYSLNAGWLLQAGRSEDAIQNFTLKSSLFGGVISPVPHPLLGLGGAVTWGDPSLTRPFDYHDLAGEVQIGNVGGVGGYLYDFWIYDSGDSTPWFWQDKDGINNINP